MNSLAYKLNCPNSSYLRKVLGKQDSELKKLSQEIAKSISDELIKTVFPEGSSKADKSHKTKKAEK